MRTSVLCGTFILAAALALGACQPAASLLAPQGAAKVSMKVSWSIGYSESRTILPSSYPSPSTYSVSLQPTGGAAVTQTGISSTSYTFSDLETKYYTITVNGFDASGHALVSGLGSADLSSSTVPSPSIIVSYIVSGTGTGSISLAFDSSAAPSAVVSTSMTLVGPSGAIVVDGASLAGSSPSFSYANDSLQVGSYNMVAKLATSNTVAVKVATILVAQSICTSATIAASSSDFKSIYVPVTSLALSKNSEGSVYVGQADTLTVNLNSGASNALVAWSSSDASVASVTQSGVVTILKPGPASASITATSADKPSIYASCSYSIPAVSISLNCSELAMTASGAKGIITATVANAVDTAATWSSSDAAIALVSGGTVDPLATGRATISAASSADPSKVATCTLTIAPNTPKGLDGIIGSHQTALSWTSASGATNYNLYWSTDSAITTATGAKVAGITTNSYTLSGLTNKTTYYVIVTSANSIGESTASGTVAQTPDYMVSTVAGGGSAGGTASGHADGTGTAATFYTPKGIAIDPSGDFYITDGLNNLIRKMTSAGVVTTIAGGGSPGGTASGHTDGTGSAATFNNPDGIAIDSAGIIYIADSSNNLIRKMTVSGEVSTFAGGGSTGGTASGCNNGAGTSATFNNPKGIQVDSTGSIYIADYGNNLIRKITPAGVVTTLAGGGSPGGTLYGHNDGTGTNATFRYPYGLAFSSSGDIIVADQFNNLIRKITPEGVVTTIAGGGSMTGAIDGYYDGTGREAKFHYPSGVAVNSSGEILVTDTSNQVIRKISTTGVVSTFAGSQYYSYSDGFVSAAKFFGPITIAIDSSGFIYITDSGNNVIRKIK